jgi:hypothetical protein
VSGCEYVCFIVVKIFPFSTSVISALVGQLKLEKLAIKGVFETRGGTSQDGIRELEIEIAFHAVCA